MRATPHYGSQTHQNAQKDNKCSQAQHQPIEAMQTLAIFSTDESEPRIFWFLLHLRHVFDGSVTLVYMS
jgi:hypothetical protein